MATPTDLTIGLVPSLSFANLLAAEDLGAWDAEGLNVTFKTTTTADSVPLLARGDLDAASAAVSGGFFNAVDSGIGVRMSILGGAYPEDGFPVDGPVPGGFYVRKDLVDSGDVTSISDLKDRTVALSGSVGTGNSILTAYFLDQGNLTWDDVNLTTVATADVKTAFDAGTIDAAAVASGFSAMVEADGVASQIADLGAMQGLSQVFLLGPRLLEDNPEVGVRFIRGLLRASEELTSRYNEDPRIVDAIAAQGAFPAQVVRDQAPYDYSRPRVTEAQVEEVQRILLARPGLLEYNEPLPYDAVVADGYRLAAEKSLSACTI
jgi:NitT/TauT family transport system substrate-binding protein